MEHAKLVEEVQGLTDLELAVLLCLVADQSCIIQTEQSDIQSLQQEIQLIASDIFGLSQTVIHCDESTTLEDFSHGILVDASPLGELDIPRSSGEPDMKESSGSDPARSGLPTTSEPNGPLSGLQQRRIANVVLITGLSKADENIQIQALELHRTRRIYTHTAVYAAAKNFIMIILSCPSDPALVGHLNDHIYLSHYHDREDGYPNLEYSSDWLEDDHNSISSVIHRSAPSIPSSRSSSHRFSMEGIRTMAALAQDVVITAECMAYLHNLVVFLRLHRAVRTGASPNATIHFRHLSRILSSIHGYAFATPDIIGLAFRKIYRHRIRITTAHFERSMQYGSDLRAVTAMLKDVTVDEILEEVLTAVEVPV